MVRDCCLSCVYAYWDRSQEIWAQVRRCPFSPACANHPESLGRMRPTRFGGLCRNYRRKLADPDKNAKQIPLGNGFYAYVDAADYEWLSRWTWQLMSGYAGRLDKGKAVFMHRLIMKPPRGKVVDHINHNKMDNCRINLRVCTRQQNSHNQRKHRGCSSRFKGVGYSKRHKRWLAQIYFEDRQVRLGLFEDEAEAAQAYDRAAIERFGEFAYLNFPDEWPPERRKELHERWLAERAKEGGRNRRTKARRPRAATRRRRVSKKTTKGPTGKTRRTQRPKKAKGPTTRRQR